MDSKDTVFGKYTEEMELDLDWPTICRMACHAMIYNMTFEEFVENAIQYGLKGKRDGF